MDGEQKRGENADDKSALFAETPKERLPSVESHDAAIEGLEGENIEPKPSNAKRI